MFKALRKLFGKRYPLSALSGQSDRRTFIRALVEADVTVLAALQSEGLDPATFTQDALLAEIERAAKDLNERDAFQPFLYGSGEAQRLPFFSTVDHAKTFCGEYSKERNRVFPFQTLTIRGSVLASLLPAGLLLVMNPRTADEYALSETDVRLLEESEQTHG